MTELHTLSWEKGEIDIWSLGCKIVPKFKINNKLVEPFHSDARGVKTTIKFTKDEEWKTEYSFSIKEI